jgi:hypothetical protein
LAAVTGGSLRVLRQSSVVCSGARFGRCARLLICVDLLRNLVFCGEVSITPSLEH